MKEFFLDKFEFDFYSMKSWISCIENQEESVSQFTLKSISHIVNVHHIWNSRILNKTSESNKWDILPVSYHTRLARQNYLETTDFLEKYELSEKIKYHSSEGIKMEKSIVDVLYHILNHSTYHRAQITMDLKQNNIQFPSLNFITYR
jgi:uncharacterized damage-inducible protein DinB